MRTTIRLSLLAAAAIAAGRPVAAQTHARVTAASTAVTDAPSTARTIVTYRFVGWRTKGMPTEIAVVDSAGRFVASYRTPGARVASPMDVLVNGNDLVLTGETPEGLLTLELHATETEGRAESRLAGRWYVGSEGGDLRGQARRLESTIASKP